MPSDLGGVLLGPVLRRSRSTLVALATTCSSVRMSPFIVVDDAGALALLELS